MWQKNKAFAVVKIIVMKRKHSLHCLQLYQTPCWQWELNLKHLFGQKSCGFGMILKFSWGNNKKNKWNSWLIVCHGRPGSTWKSHQCCQAMKMAFHYFLAQLEKSLCAEGQAGEQCKSWQNVLFFVVIFFFNRTDFSVFPCFHSQLCDVIWGCSRFCLGQTHICNQSG